MGGDIVHEIMSNDDYFMRGWVLGAHPEDIEHMKYVDNNIIYETQVKPAEVEVNPDDDDGLKFVKVMDRIENQEIDEDDLKYTDDDSRRMGSRKRIYNNNLLSMMIYNMYN